MRFHRIFIVIFFLVLVASPSTAQEPASIKASVNTNRILIGEPFQLTVEAVFPADAKRYFPAIDSIAHFEFHGKPVTDSSEALVRKVYTLTSFDSGHWVIPSFVLSGAIKTDTIPMDVVFSVFDPNQPYHDIKDIIDIKPEEKKEWWWYAAGGGLLLLLILYLLLRKKKPAPVTRSAVQVNAYEEALQELKQLGQHKTDPKTYYSRLSDIFRLYIYRKKGILSLQKTTDDLVTQLKGLNLPAEGFNNLSQALRLSDFVKFAKYVPSEDDRAGSLDSIRSSIDEIERLN
jgi:LPXTG-motif cell wall-anchored protein